MKQKVFLKNNIYEKFKLFFELKLNPSNDSNIYIEVSFPAEIKTHKFLYTYINENLREREYKLLVTSSSKKDSLNNNNNIYNYQIEKKIRQVYYIFQFKLMKIFLKIQKLQYIIIKIILLQNGF